MTESEFRNLSREDQYLALSKMPDNESRDLRRALVAAGQEPTYARAASDVRTIANLHLTNKRHRDELIAEFQKEKTHRESGAHRLANEK